MLVGKTARLIAFLREIAQVRRPPVRDLRDYDRDGFSMFLATLPAKVRIDSAAEAGGVLVEVQRTAREPVPRPPAALEEWLDLTTLDRSDEKAPRLRALGTADEFTDPPNMPFEVVRLYDAWLPRWQAWADRDREGERARLWHDAIANAAHRLSQQDDQFELVLAVGLLKWRDENKKVVRNHLLTVRLHPEIDGSVAAARLVVADDASLRLQDRELLDGVDQYDPQRVSHLHERIRVGDFPAPLGDAEAILREWSARALDLAVELDESWTDNLDVDGTPKLSVSPAIVFRRRDRASLVNYFDAMLEKLSGPSASTPLGLAQLVTALDEAQRQEWLQQQGAVAGEVLGADPLFPLPANPEQRQILRRMSANNGVVVQGPPGTGKTHTIANLVAALLAEGQRVLVTSQKAQALRVLRDKLPEEIADLCVSLTDQGRGGSAELGRSVNALSARYADFDAVAHERLVSRQTDKYRHARQEVARLADDLRSLREAETYQHSEIAPGYSGTLAAIVQTLRTEERRLGWMPFPLPESASPAPPLDAAEAAELIDLLSAATPGRRARVSQSLPDLRTLPSTEQFRAMVADETAAFDEARAAATPESQRLQSAGPAVLEALQRGLDDADAALTECGVLDSRAEDWVARAVADGLAGREQSVWRQLAAQGRVAMEAQHRLDQVGLREVTLPDFTMQGPASLSAQLQAAIRLRDHLAAGNSLRRHFRPDVQKAAESLLDGALVDGVPVGTLEQLELVIAALSARQLRSALTREWAQVGVVISDDLPLRRAIGQLIDDHNLLSRALAAVDRTIAVRQILRSAGVTLATSTLTEWAALRKAVGGVRVRFAAERAAAAISELGESIEHRVRQGGAPPELTHALTAVRARDVQAYTLALASLADAQREQSEQRRGEELLARVRVGHPGLATFMERSATDQEWPGRLGAWAQAWGWAMAATFVERQRQPDREHVVSAELDAATEQLQRETARLAAAQAWGHCLGRMTAEQTQALLAYKDHMRSVGMGTGRYASRYQARAREAMRESRGAVPAWVMPIDQVLESMPPVQDSFDVVIVDEASQAGIEALFLLWLAPRVIVVGDEKQCAPSVVTHGELQPIFDKLESYLPDMPGYLRDSFTPKSSLFDILQTRFGGVVRLREHFRCMPEIIGYSSRMFYSDQPLVPLRQFGADRLPPLRTTRIEGAYEEGSVTRLRNVAEATAIVDAIAGCVGDPAYRGATLGVVVLQGTGQIQLIHNLLLERLDPKVWDERQLRVGAPPDFQGDERDVIFLSMVVAERHNAVTSMEWQRRFNVAASRARNQLWLFHSVSPDLLSPADLRRGLLAYALNPPPAERRDMPRDVRPDTPHPDFDSLFEQRVFLRISERGYHVTPQFEVNGRRIDLVITGARGRLAVECDGDRWHGSPEQVAFDVDRERELKRAGWRFWRIRESEFYFDPEAAMESLWKTLARLSISPHSGPGERIQTVGGEVWLPSPLSTEEGWDGLEGDGVDAMEAPAPLPARRVTVSPTVGGSRTVRTAKPPTPAPASPARVAAETIAPDSVPLQRSGDGSSAPIRSGRSITSYTRVELQKLFLWLIERHPDAGDGELMRRAREVLASPDEDAWVFEGRIRQALDAVSRAKTRPRSSGPVTQTLTPIEDSIPTSGEVREWARAQGMKVVERGALGGDIIARYNMAHPDRPFPPGR